jgi:Flp pilus assembly protein TadG
MFRSGFVAVKHNLAKFRREEDGALVVFGLVLLSLMLIMLGIGMDVAKSEYMRTRLANTEDRGTLAAAALSQTLDPEAVVRDYALKAGIANQITGVTVTQGLNSRTVKVTGSVDTKPYFFPMIGIDKLEVAAVSQAEQSIQNVEIVLVLDVSGSMSGQKIANLKIAATEFIDTVMANDPHHKVSIAIVPYNAQVNIGTDLRSAFNLTHVANVQDVNCVEIPDSTFASQPISTTTPMAMMAYADIAYGTNTANTYTAPTDVNNALPNYANAFCKPTTVNVVRLPSSDAATLKAQINALVAGGNTSITLGMKWGATLIDPSMRPAYANFIVDGKMSPNLVARPFDYGDNVQKVVVLMTDGEHVAHNRINDAYKTGPSGIYKAADGKYSVRFQTGRPAAAGANEYYVPHLNTWQATPWNNGVQQDWANIWSQVRLSYVAW